MTERKRAVIRRLPSGAPGLDAVLGGGIPEYSFNLLAGEPGSGKTTLAQQFVFENAAPDRTAIFFTILGEPPLKMLRYQQQFSFFDAGKVGTSVRFVNLTDDIIQRGLDGVLDRIAREVAESAAGIVVVDSFRSLEGHAGALDERPRELQEFLQRLAIQLTSWEVTSFLIGEYDEVDKRNNAVFTVADTIIWLSQPPENNSVVRKLQVV